MRKLVVFLSLFVLGLVSTGCSIFDAGANVVDTGTNLAGSGISAAGKGVGSFLGVYDYPEQFDPDNPAYQQDFLKLYVVKPDAQPMVGGILTLTDFMLNGPLPPELIAAAKERQADLVEDSEAAPSLLRLSPLQYVAILGMLDTDGDCHITVGEAQTGATKFMGRSAGQLGGELNAMLKRSSAMRVKEAERSKSPDAKNPTGPTFSGPVGDVKP